MSNVWTFVINIKYFGNAMLVVCGLESICVVREDVRWLKWLGWLYRKLIEITEREKTDCFVKSIASAFATCGSPASRSIASEMSAKKAIEIFVCGICDSRQRVVRSAAITTEIGAS
jgi:hypothetical protein